MSRKVGQIITRGDRRWLVRVYLGRDRETRKRTMYGTLFAVLITTGMRPSECIGLKWQDFDWKRGTVSIKRTLRKGPTGQWEYGDTKRAGSRRLVRLQNWVPARLKQLREFQATHPVVDPEEWPEAVDLIFVTEFGRPVNVNCVVYKHFKPILKRAGRPNIRLYDLRHTAATLALTVGVSPKVVSEQLGHTSAAFTLDVYSHVLHTCKTMLPQGWKRR
jgi:integrase